MKSFGLVSAAVLMITFAGQAAFAQSNGVPAEFPPASFTGNQFVDSRGCAFVRAGIGGNVNWIPRVTRTRDQLCNFQPTGGAAVAAPAQVQASNAPNPLAGLPPAAEVAAANNIAIAATPAPVRAAVATTTIAPRVGNVGAPIQTVASLTTTPRINQPTATVRQPTPTVAATPRVVTPAPAAAPAERRITLAEACAGKFGVQPGFISAQTRQPINCGPAPVQTVVAAAPVILPTVAPSAGPRQMTLAQACSEISATGRQYVNAATGLPVRCGPQEQPLASGHVFAGSTVAPSVPTGPLAAAAPLAPSIQPARTIASSCSNISSVGSQYLTGGTGLPVRCGPQVQPPAGFQVSRRASAPATASFFGSPEVPASNPTGYVSAAPVEPPSGYERVWGDGRLNAQRGLPRAAIQQTVIRQTARVSPQTVAPTAVASGHRYVQVGTFGDAANAQRTTQRFQGMGLPVAAGRSGGVQVLAIGPFSNVGDLQRAFQAARGAGFTRAFTRN